MASPDPSTSQPLSDQGARVLWSTPSYGDEPNQHTHVKTTAKQIQVKDARYRWVERFSREGATGNVLGVKDGLGSSSRYLFDNRVACLLFMAERARTQAKSADRKARDLRAWAAAREAEAALAADEQEAAS